MGIQQLTRSLQWIGPGTSTNVGGFVIPNGMLYVGRGLLAPGGGIDPALIDPQLKVAVGHADVSNARMGYWPSYSEISPAARAGYLSWLAGGRRDPRADIGFVFLFMYGLERRVLVDLAADRRLGVELAPMLDEMQRLLNLYGQNRVGR